MLYYENPTKPRGRWKHILFLCLGIFLLIVVIYNYQRQELRLQGLPTTEAQVVASYHPSHGNEYVEIRYSVDGQTYTDWFRDPMLRLLMSRGDRMTVAYVPDKPDRVYVAGLLGHSGELLGWILVLVFFLLSGYPKRAVCSLLGKEPEEASDENPEEELRLREPSQNPRETQMKRQLRRARGNRIGVLAVCIGFGLLALIGAPISYFKNQAETRDLPSVRAVITETKSSKYEHSVVVEYEVDGKRYTRELDGRGKKGQEIMILYDPENPERVYENEHTEGKTFIAGLVMLLVGIYIWKKSPIQAFAR